jgi:hypothetical protein
VTYNALSTSTTQCGAPSGTTILSGSATSLVTFALTLDPTHTAAGLATISISGPNGAWFGVGLGASVMADVPNAIIVLGNGTVFEQKLANQDPGSRLPMSLTIVSNTVAAGVRTVVATRAFKGATPGHYTFDPTKSSLDFINALGLGPTLAYHKNRAGAVLSLVAPNAPTCLCDTGAKSYISSDMNPSLALFEKDCLSEPFGDLVQLHNPTCTIEHYAGGLKCCTSRNILLDVDQNPWSEPEHRLEYYMKFRFYYEDYTPSPDPASAPEKASHQNLLRVWMQTERNSG